MRFECCVSKTTRARSQTRLSPTRTYAHACNDARYTDTHTHTQMYIIVIAFPLQQRLRERAWMLRYSYIACLVLCCFISLMISCLSVEICRFKIIQTTEIIKLWLLLSLHLMYLHENGMFYVLEHFLYHRSLNGHGIHQGRNVFLHRPKSYTHHLLSEPEDSYLRAHNCFQARWLSCCRLVNRWTWQRCM